MRSIAWLTLLVLSGCLQQRIDLVGVDLDGDGYHSGIDCDDDDPNVNPGMTEIPYNGVDDDCNPDTPDDDLDGDGFGIEDDCDDLDPSVHPDAVEVCNGRDDNCDGEVDGGLAVTWYRDADGDGFGDPDTTRETCAVEAGWVRNDLDCDDEDASVNPLAEEVCDGVDNNCNDIVDDDATVLLTWYRDADGDTFGDIDDIAYACDPPTGYVANPDDCDDDPITGPDVYPGADEVCNGVDNDCDGTPDNDALDANTYYLDADGDTYGTPDVTLVACANPDPTLWVTNADDCWDFDDTAYPGADEVCSGIDNDCDGTPDNDPVGAPTWYRDADGDGFGDPENSAARCDDGEGAWVANALDCDDDPTDGHLSFPGNPEVCDGRDNDCNEIVDDAPDAPLWFIDLDGDGFGDPAVAVKACDDPSDNDTQWADNNDDCDDDAVTGADVNPDATETCNGRDDDCNGLVDDGAAPLLTWYLDGDGDTYGSDDATVTGCSAPTPLHVALGGDCDDTDPAINPGAEQECGPRDTNCDDETPLPTDCVWGATCSEVLAAFPEVAGLDRDYLLDPSDDGTGDVYFCDMTPGDDDKPGAGWMLLVDHDFEDLSANGWLFLDLGDDPGEERVPAVTECGAFGNILGGYDETAGGAFKRRFTDIPHTELWVEVDVIQIDSWDDEVVWVSIFEDVIPSYDYLLWFDSLDDADVGGQNICGNPDESTWFDSTRRVTEHAASDADPFELRITNVLNFVPTNESIGIDNVELWVR